MIPRPQHFGDRAPFPCYRPGIVRIFQETLLEALLLSAGGRAHYPGKQPHASIEDHHRAELAAMVILDACVRLLPGVMGAASSGEEESFEQGLLEYPHYTRPVTWEGRTIPEVLRSGDHAKIAAWRHERAIEDTRLRRPDLIERHGGASQAPPSGARRRDTKA